MPRQRALRGSAGQCVNEDPQPTVLSAKRNTGEVLFQRALFRGKVLAFEGGLWIPQPEPIPKKCTIS
jgi:hypothetical protein